MQIKSWSVGQRRDHKIYVGLLRDRDQEIIIAAAKIFLCRQIIKNHFFQLLSFSQSYWYKGFILTPMLRGGQEKSMSFP